MPDVNEFVLIANWNNDLSAIVDYDMKYINSANEYLPPNSNGVIRNNQWDNVKQTISLNVFMKNMNNVDIGPHKRPNP